MKDKQSRPMFDNHENENNEMGDSIEGSPAVADPMPDLLNALPDLLEDAEEPAEIERQTLNKAVNFLFIAGLVVSIASILVGIALLVIDGQSLPEKTSTLRQIGAGLKVGRPSSFLDGGLLLLIGTPVLRLLGVLIEFAGSRNWRYAGLAFMVMLILAFSALIGS
jgi:uncharacterized membrane protein